MHAKARYDLESIDQDKPIVGEQNERLRSSQTFRDTSLTHRRLGYPFVRLRPHRASIRFTKRLQYTLKNFAFTKHGNNIEHPSYTSKNPTPLSRLEKGILKCILKSPVDQS